MHIAETHCISIVGAGLAGTLLALRLADRGHNVKLYERHPDPQHAAVPSGRSINLALAERGRYALHQARLLPLVDKLAIPMAGRMIHPLTGDGVFQPYGQHPEEVIYSVHRDQLSRLLLDQARQQPRIELHFDQRLTAVDFDQRRASFIDDTSGRQHHHHYQVLIGADGAGSALRQAMEASDGHRVQADLLDHAYREFTIPPTRDGEFAIAPNALHIWPRGGFMLIALPNPDRSFTATLFLAREGQPSFADIPETVTHWRAFLQQHFAQAVPLLSRLEHDLATHPVGRMGTIRCDRWYFNDNALILGDAAHAVVPFHGQGMNAAFEDVDELMALLSEHQTWPALMRAFQQRRKPNTDALAAMALENYEEMRHGVRDARHLQRKELEWELERRFPRRFIPRYSMVMFHRLPYATAMQRGAIQRDILDALLNIDDPQHRLQQAEAWIHQRLAEIDITPTTASTTDTTTTRRPSRYSL